ncbi:hypothetical protein R5029_15875 [Pseudomonas aeruginosa]|uniref:hypothetical protein n=1 Tax=Pseudomonas aeruginosa TaxID=287 RepID=UPI000F890E21|nr:hypothetical protein [Pseudomonas aeruginosa]RSZ54060.1 hypothetical protein EJU38_05485 [Pseudomonas aeruginosa]WOT60876.1 hypothetical protein R5018_25115 [Pseudomonas aeruginosa]WOT74316.1 hypothetical protein R5026_27840 [Pseudomonas aeruginosa]WOT85437.1 hypothetical protein R5020_18800 [Pseudomonas aeruginosa]WOU41993.1 hypothetical protein R5029_15875 [Pseudomonas aeruginosa]
MTKVAFNTPALTSSTVALPDFKRVCQELHDQLLAAGMVAASDTGQLDFDSITTLTASMSYGFRIYQLDDGISLPVFLKIRYAANNTFSSANRIPWTFFVSLGIGTNGAGSLVNGTPEYALTTSGGNFLTHRTAAIGQNLQSFICVLPGFLGVSFKQLCIEPSGAYGPSAALADAPGLLGFFVCRDCNDAGEPTADGVSLVLIARGGRYSGGKLGVAPSCTHIDAAGVVVESNRIGLALGAERVVTVEGKIPLYNLYTMTPKPRRLAQLLCAARTVGASGNDEAVAAAVGTEERNFLVMNPEWPADVFTGTDCRSCIAMLWE